MRSPISRTSFGYTNTDQTNKRDPQRLHVKTSMTQNTSKFNDHSPNSANFQEYLENYLPKHKKSMDPQFLLWFIGFFEGDGTFAQWRRVKTPKTDPVNRFAFSIEQKNNTRLLYTIRSTLGFGKVTTHSRGATYRVGKKEDLIRLLILFHGNLSLAHRRAQVENVVQNMSLAGWDLPESLSRRNLPLIRPSLESSWMAGFFDADAGFASNRTRTFQDKKPGSDDFLRLRIQLKFYITQKQEDVETLEQIGELFNPGGWRIYDISSGHSSVKYARLEFGRGSAHDRILEYLKMHPLKGTRRIDAKIFSLLRTRQIQRGSRFNTLKMARRTARLLDRLSKTRHEKDE